MAYQLKEFSKVDPESMKSWIGTFVRDTTLGDIGMVRGIDAEATPATLLVRFPGESADRVIAIEPLKESLEYINLDDPRARYRRPTNVELQAARDSAARKRVT